MKNVPDSPLRPTSRRAPGRRRSQGPCFSAIGHRSYASENATANWLGPSSPAKAYSLQHRPHHKYEIVSGGHQRDLFTVWVAALGTLEIRSHCRRSALRLPAGLGDQSADDRSALARDVPQPILVTERSCPAWSSPLLFKSAMKLPQSDLARLKSGLLSERAGEVPAVKLKREISGLRRSMRR
jgi:hypothetical protein